MLEIEPFFDIILIIRQMLYFLFIYRYKNKIKKIIFSKNETRTVVSL